MEYTVKIIGPEKTIEKKVKSGTNILDFLHKNRIDVNAGCNGNKTCGKCKIRVHGLNSFPENKERKLLGSKALDKGYRLACYNKIESDTDIYLEEYGGQAVIATEAKESSFEIEPVITKHHVVLDKPDTDSQESLVERVLSASGVNKMSNSLSIMKELPGNIEKGAYEVTLVCTEKKIIGVEPGNTGSKLLGAAFDIGTTTVVGYLVDLLDGSKLCTVSMLNPQRIFGADVISRIKHTCRSQKSAREMNKIVIDCINSIIARFQKEAGIERDDIYLASFVGNTTMMHFLMNIPAGGLAVSPFIPVTARAHKFKACDMGVKINKNGYIMILPSVSAYVGADTVAAVLSSRMYMEKDITLLIDIGTNGEMVLGNNKWLYSCSTAAGPAFEGANIRNGVGGIEGAIDKISFTPEFKISTIGDRRAIGVCGSGVVDIVAEMLENGICNKSGRIIDADEISQLNAHLKSRLIEIDGMKSFLILKSEDCDADNDIAITQKDIREVQNAKAAIAAGIGILAARAGIKPDDVDKVILAGSFGSYMNVDNAHKIGLIPAELKGKVTSIGNAAGSGAVQGLLSKKLFNKASEIKDKIKYIELSVSEEFMEHYIECMSF